MNIKIKLLCFFAYLLLLAGCAPENMVHNTAPVSYDSSTPDSTLTGNQIVLKTTVPDQENISTPYHIKKNLSDNIIINADIVAPSVSQIPILVMEPTRFDENTIKEAFFPDIPTNKQVITDTWIDGSDNPMITFTADQIFLTMSKSYLYYINNQLNVYDLPLMGLAQYKQSTSATYGDIYTKDKLDNIDKTTAVDKVTELLKSIGLSLYGEPAVYSLDHASMQKWQDDMLKSQDLSGEINNNKIAIKSVLTTEDEAYLMIFQGGLDNIPITQTSYIINTSERSMNGMSIEVLYSSKGIVHCSILGANKMRSIEDPQTLISVDTAINLLQERWESILSNMKSNITHIALEYVPVPKPNDLSMVLYTPCWVFTVEVSSQSTKGGSTYETSREMFYYVNAVSGDIIN